MYVYTEIYLVFAIIVVTLQSINDIDVTYTYKILLILSSAIQHNDLD